MMEEWDKYTFEKCIVKNKIGRDNQINASEILNDGEFPVIDQGQSFIAGYTNEIEKVISIDLPYIVFGDHTRCFKYVDFPFIIGADGTKVISPNIELFDPKYFYFQLRSLDIQNRGYNRHFKLLKEKVLNRPPLPEQRKIAHVLSTVQKAIKQQDKLIRTTTELKKALMQKLFTEGTRGEPQKETEIGLVPESWEVVNLIDVCEKPQYGFTDSASKEGNAQFLRITDITEFGVKWNEVPYCNCPDYKKYELKNGDIVFARIGATTGKSYLIKNPPKSVYASYLIRVRCRDEILPEFLINYFETEQYWSQINARKGDNLKGGVNGSILSKLFTPKPSLGDQEKMASTFMILDKKIAFSLSKKQTLTDLFKTLLYELMTGQRRVHELEFDEMEDFQ